MQAAMDSAGPFVGLGDGHSIGFGRFTVEKFEIEEASEELKKGKKRKVA